MNMKRVLLLYKRSVLENYFLERKSSLFGKHPLLSSRDRREFKSAHRVHYKTLAHVEKALRRHGMKYSKFCRGQKINFRGFDFVISVGGDGTFLEAARGIYRQPILGVNSDPQRSVGRFCSATASDFEQILKKILAGRFSVKRLNRMRVRLKQSAKINALNDILVCHKNPAAMSRYRLSIGSTSEEQRNSGLWIATASGSTGAIKSAGGKVLPAGSEKIQYKPRELHHWRKRRYKLTGAVVSPKAKIKVQSLMRQGAVFIDGAHFRLPFQFGENITVENSPEPLNCVVLR